MLGGQKNIQKEVEMLSVCMLDSALQANIYTAVLGRLTFVHPLACPCRPPGLLLGNGSQSLLCYFIQLPAQCGVRGQGTS